MSKNILKNIKQKLNLKRRKMDPNTKTVFFFAVFFVYLCSPKISLVHAHEAGEKIQYTYKQKTDNGPAEWGKINPDWKVCNAGKMQSPIDLTNERVSLIHDQAWKREYKPAPAIIIDRGHDIMVSWKGDAGKITIHQTDYKLVQCHWHSPSEHTINGTSYDLELHMVHTSAQGKTAVIGVLYKLGEPNEFLTKLLNGIKAVTKKEMSLGMVDPRDIRFHTKIYRYIGSFTAPPCTEGVIWNVVRRVNTVSMEQIAALKEAVDDGFEKNSRPVQDPHGRTVWFYDQDF